MIKQQAQQSIQKQIYTISELTAQIKHMIESKFSIIWVTGEISNFRVPYSGHYYFTMKDAKSQLNAVMFRGQNQYLKCKLKDGMHIIAMGRLSIYEPAGTYQIIIEYIEPVGIGSLQLAFEQLKKKLANEGLFSQHNKKSIPFIPNLIALITSPSGAVVHDMLTIINRRFPRPVQIIPVKVQGDHAANEIVNAIASVNHLKQADVIILGRGGGGIEDFVAFNSEKVARAIFASTIPIISAVGHETDYTISDFVADVRAPTPSAAAELVVPDIKDLKSTVLHYQNQLITASQHYIRIHRMMVNNHLNRLCQKALPIEALRMKIDYMTQRIAQSMFQRVQHEKNQLKWQIEALNTQNPKTRLNEFKRRIINFHDTLLHAINSKLNAYKTHLHNQHEKLFAYSPHATLRRGYSITRKLPEQTIIRDANQVSIGQHVEIIIANGILRCVIDDIQN